VSHEVVGEHLHGEVRHRPGLGGGDVAGVTDGENALVLDRHQGVPVYRYVVEFVAEARAGDEVGTHVQRYGHQQVERDLPPVVGHQRLGVVVDALHEEVRLHADVPVLEHVPQPGGADRLGEGARQRGGVHDLGPVPDPPPPQVRLDQEGEFQRRHRALDGHVGDVYDQPASD